MKPEMSGSAMLHELPQGNNGIRTPYSLTLGREGGDGDRPGRIVRKIEDVGASGDRGAERIITEYGYDGAGRLELVTVNGRETERYAYDEQGRRQHDRQAVDRFGEPGRNVSGRTWMYGRGDQLQSAGLGHGFDYDAQGRLVCERKGSGLLQWSVQVAYEELPGAQGVDLPVRLESYEPAPVNLRPTRRPANRMALGRRGAAGAQGGPGGRGRPNPILASSVEYAYDEAGCRRARRVDGEVTHVFDWHDPLRLARILDGPGREWARFHYEGDTRLPRAVSCQGTVLYLYFDHLGSLRVVADRQGNIVRCIEYESFGCVTRDTNPALYLGYGFAGGLHDPDVGTVRFWLRDYDPTLARFLTPDPAHRGETAAAGQEAGARQDAGKGQPAVDPDRYGYCLDDPVNMADETGMFLDAVSEFFGKVTDGVSEAVSGGAEAAGDAIGKTVDTFANDPGMHEGLKTAGKYAAIAAGGTALGVAGMAGGAAAATGVLGIGTEMLGSGLAAYAPGAVAAARTVQSGAKAMVGKAGQAAKSAAKIVEPKYYSHAGKAQIAAEVAKGALDPSPPSSNTEGVGVIIRKAYDDVLAPMWKNLRR